MSDNEILAEWLGWTQKSQPAFRTVFADDECCCHPIREEYVWTGWHLPECVCPKNVTLGVCVAANVPDFLTDERANAMLRDKLLANGFSFYVRQDGTDVFRAEWLWQKFMVAPNTAIVQAALALIRSQA